MPKSKFENVVFTIIMATIMVYGIGNEFSHGNLLSDVLLWPIRIYECIYEWTIFFLTKTNMYAMCCGYGVENRIYYRHERWSDES